MNESKINNDTVNLGNELDRQFAGKQIGNSRSRRLGGWLFTGVLISVVVGCGQDVGKEKMDLAEKSVRQGLELWQAGIDIKSMRTLDVPVEFYDDDWEKSARLIDFEIRNTFMESDGTARCSVSLQVQYEDQEPNEVQCTYQVVDDPKIKIARDPMS